MSQFHHEISVCILFVGVSRGVAEQSGVKMANHHHISSDILHVICRHPRHEVLTLTTPGDEIFTKASSNLHVHYFIYLINGPVQYSYGGQFLAVKLAVYRRAV